MARSSQQEAALKAVSRWLQNGGQQVFRLFGYAGTGKTTLARQIAADVSGHVLFGSFTGKAAQVLRQKGCSDARTLHSLIYTLKEEQEGKPVFVLNPNSEIRRASLLIVDEVSMVDQALGQDLLSFGTKILVLGDPAQLPPVSSSEGYFDTTEPDVMLTEIHRQAADNPIIRMATTVRESGRLEPGRYGQSEVLRPGSRVETDQALAADQILVGRNITRQQHNSTIRQLRGFCGYLPRSNEKLVCLKNDKDKGTLNGSLWSVDRVLQENPKTVKMRLLPEIGFGPTTVSVPKEYFTGQESLLDWRVKRFADSFTFGYALTVHKAQGSQWDDVLIFDESAYFREHRSRWLYTALTRAAEKVTVVSLDEVANVERSKRNTWRACA